MGIGTTDAVLELPGLDSVVVALAIRNTVVAAGEMDTVAAEVAAEGMDAVVAVVAELRTGVGTVVVEGELHTDTAIAERLGMGLEASWEIDFVEEKLAFDWLGCKLAADQIDYMPAAAVVVVQKTADRTHHSTTGYKQLVHTVRQSSRLGTNYQFGPLVRKVKQIKQRISFLSRSQTSLNIC